MDGEIICVYQDCVLCGDRGKKLKKLIFDKGLNVRKVSFASDEGKNLIHEAVFKHKIGAVPFFTDGKKFSVKLEDFVKKPEEIVSKTEKKAKNRKKVVKDETDR